METWEKLRLIWIQMISAVQFGDLDAATIGVKLGGTNEVMINSQYSGGNCELETDKQSLSAKGPLTYSSKPTRLPYQDESPVMMKLTSKSVRQWTCSKSKLRRFSTREVLYLENNRRAWMAGRISKINTKMGIELKEKIRKLPLRMKALWM